MNATNGSEHAGDMLCHPDLASVPKGHIGVLPVFRQQRNPPGNAHLGEVRQQCASEDLNAESISAFQILRLWPLFS